MTRISFSLKKRYTSWVTRQSASREMPLKPISTGRGEGARLRVHHRVTDKYRGVSISAPP